MELFSDEYFMNVALKEAKKAFAENEVPVGAIVVARKQIVAKAYNQISRFDSRSDTSVLKTSSNDWFLLAM